MRGARALRRAGAAIAALPFLAACGILPQKGGAPVIAHEGGVEPASPPGGRPSALPEAFESEEFVVTFPGPKDSAESLAAKYLGDGAKAWMIEDYNAETGIAPGKPVVIPKQFWNLAGVEPRGHQVVPVLVYHNLGAQARGRLVIAVKSFEEQMRYLKAQGYRVVGLRDLYGFISFRQQLPRRAVVLTFDDGYKAFLQYVYPILKELGFPATLFVYTDFVGAGRNALNWEELRFLAAEGFDIQAHSKTHGDLRRRPGEPDGEYARRMKTELGEPQVSFERWLGRRPDMLAYPYGYYDDDLLERVKEFGYVSGFSVRREGNPAFVPPLRAFRSQIYAEMTLEEFAKNLMVFTPEPSR